MDKLKSNKQALQRHGQLTLGDDDVDRFTQYLHNSGLSPNTVQYYKTSARSFVIFMDGGPLCQNSAMAFKEYVLLQHTANSVNGIILGLNRFLEFLGRSDLRVARIKCIPKEVAESGRELTVEDIPRMLAAARSNDKDRGELLLRTIFATGINVSEVIHITVEAAESGKAKIPKKDRIREVIIPDALCGMLLKYAEERGIIRGSIFLSKSGRPLHRMDIFREIKTIAELSGIDCNTNPSSLRKLFGRTYYSSFSNLLETVDVLGNKTAATGIAFVPTPSKDGYRENLNKLFTAAQG